MRAFLAGIWSSFWDQAYTFQGSLQAMIASMGPIHWAIFVLGSLFLWGVIGRKR